MEHGWWKDFLRECKASFAFVERNYFLVKRYLGWEVVFLVYSVVNALTIGLIGMDSTSGPGQSDRVLFLVIGALFWNFLGVLFMLVSESVAWERWEGTIEYTFMAPIRRLTHLGGVCIFGVIYGTVRTIIILLVLHSFLDFNLARANIPGGLLILVSSSLAFIGLGLIAAVFPLMSPERGPQATNILQALILLISGVYYRIEVLPAWLQPLGKFSPGTYAIEGARMALINGYSLGRLTPYILKSLFFGFLLIPLGLLIFTLGERHAMKVGKLKRTG